MRKTIILISVFSLVMAFTFNACQEGKDSEKHHATRLELTSESIAVGVFKGNGASPTCVKEAIEALQIDDGIVCVSLTAHEIVKSELENIDVLLLPGGSGSKMMNNLGEQGKEVVQKFVKKKGKGLVGICAGAYMVSSTENYPTLNLLPVKVVDRDHYNRGNGLVEFKITEEGENLFPELIGLEDLFMEYYEGPMYEIFDGKEKKVQVQATILSDIHQKGNASEGITPGKPFMINGKAGRGKVFAAIGHPESTPGMRWLVPRMVRWVGNKDIISYDGSVVRPDLFTAEILYTEKMDRKVDSLFYALFSDDPEQQIKTIEELDEMRSWSGKKWIAGLLRDDDPEVRIAAAEYFGNNEYTAIIPELQVAVDMEKDDTVKAELQAVLTALERMRDQTGREN